VTALNRYGVGDGWAEFLAHTQPANIDIAGVQLAYVDVPGPGSGPPLVLLHGIGNTWRFWTSHLIDPPATPSRLVAFDLPGFGASSTPEEGISARLTGHLIASACDVLAINRAVFVGHSMGALGALSIAADHPDLAAGAVAIAPALQDILRFHTQPTSILGRPILAAKYGGLLLAALRPIPQAATNLAATSAVVRRVAFGMFVRYPHLIPADVVRACAIGTGAPGVRQILATASQFDYRTALDRIAAPVLAINGTHDRLSTLDAVDRIFSRREDTTVVVLDDTGHWPMIERPTVVNQAIDDWLTVL
jgi:pimeloyl-ACP methyl ester carboxylesterase